MRNPAQPRGFTLVEVMMVVTIIGVLAALALPEFNGVLKRTRARTQYANISMHIRSARNTSRTTLCEQKVTVDVSANTISYGPVLTTGVCGTLNTFVRQIDADLVTLTAPKVGAVVTNPVKFNISGGTDYTGDFTIAADASIPSVDDVTFHVWPLVGTVEKI